MALGISDRPSALREAVRDAYSAVALHPGEEHPLPVGRALAEALGYPAELLDRLSPASVDAFSGVAAVSLTADLPPGSRVLDLGCGAGLDSLIAAQRLGPRGRVVGIDFGDAMLARARHGADETGLRASFCQAAAEQVPLHDAAFDIALVNGIFNLNPARAAIFAELARVVRPGGVVYGAELIAREAIIVDGPPSARDWFS